MRSFCLKTTGTGKASRKKPVIYKRVVRLINPLTSRTRTRMRTYVQISKQTGIDSFIAAPGLLHSYILSAVRGDKASRSCLSIGRD